MILEIAFFAQERAKKQTEDTSFVGMPVSKNEFVQEIGRAGRAEERVDRYFLSY